jgi:hypothetical protein
LDRRLDNIKEVVDAGARLTKKVCDAFDLFEQLANQVIEASSLSMKQTEKKILNDFEEVMNMEANLKKETARY